MDFQEIQIGMTGQQFTDAINNNKDKTIEILNELSSKILSRVIANNVKEVKVVDNKLYFTLNGTDWISSDNNIWGSIIGDISNQKDLITLLNTKATSKSVTDLSDSVNSLSIDLSSTKENVEKNKTSISENKSSIGDLQKKISDKVSSSSILAFRISATGFLQYSLDNVTWIDVQSVADINWGSIGGELSNQVDLQNALNSRVKNSDFKAHTQDSSNPHKVTKEQVGLSDVDNTSDENKPISKAQQLKFTSIDKLIENMSNEMLVKTDDIKSIEYITLEDYNDKKSKSELSDTTIYIVD